MEHGDLRFWIDMLVASAIIGVTNEVTTPLAREARSDLDFVRIERHDDDLPIASDISLWIRGLKPSRHFLQELRLPISRVLLEASVHLCRQDK